MGPFPFCYLFIGVMWRPVGGVCQNCLLWAASHYYSDIYIYRYYLAFYFPYPKYGVLVIRAAPPQGTLPRSFTHSIHSTSVHSLRSVHSLPVSLPFSQSYSVSLSLSQSLSVSRSRSTHLVDFSLSQSLSPDSPTHPLTLTLSQS